MTPVALSHPGPVLTAILLAYSALGTLAAQDIGPTGYGFRGDGSGVYPGSKPPTEWSDTKNVRWKAKLPNWGYACPVPVAGRVFVMAEPFPPHYWPRLGCYDADTGKLLWTRDVDPLDTFPDLSETERKSVLDKMALFHDGLAAAYRICQPLLAKGTTKTGDPILVDMNQQLAEYGLSIGSYRPGYGLLRELSSVDEATMRTREAAAKELKKKYDITATTTWQSFGWARVGACFPTPVSDGERIYVTTIHGTVACFAVDSGDLLWSRRAGYKGHHGAMPSPRLWKNTLLTFWLQGTLKAGKIQLVAYDTKTGKESWRHEGDAVAKRTGIPEGAPEYSRMGGSVQVMTLGDTPVASLCTGRFLRLTDGVMLDGGIPMHLASLAIDDGNDAVYGGGNGDRKNGVWGYRLRLAGDAVEAERIWHNPNDNAAPSWVFTDGRLFNAAGRLDPQTGFIWGTGQFPGRKTPRTGPDARHLLLVANGHVYGLSQEGGAKKKAPAFGVCGVYTLDGKQVAENRLAADPWEDPEIRDRLQQQGFQQDFSYSCSMNIADDRLYIASQDHLYCIGER